MTNSELLFFSFRRCSFSRYWILVPWICLRFYHFLYWTYFLIIIIDLSFRLVGLSIRSTYLSLSSDRHTYIAKQQDLRWMDMSSLSFCLTTQHLSLSERGHTSTSNTQQEITRGMRYSLWLRPVGRIVGSFAFIGHRTGRVWSFQFNSSIHGNFFLRYLRI